MTNVGLIGCGQWGNNIARNLKELGYEVYAFDSNKHALMDACQRHGLIAAEESEILSICEEVFIATTATSHYDLCKNFILDGMHVYCTKPVAMSSKQVIELLDLAKEKGVDLNPGYVYRESIGFGLFRSYSKMYALTHVCMKFLNPKPPRTDSNIVFNIGIHYLDLVGNILGYPRSLCCKFVNNWGKINLFYKDFTLDISLANNTAVKDRHAILVHNKGVSTKKVDFDKNDWDILKRSIEKFVSDGNKYYDNVVGVRLCELCEESNKTGDVISCDKEKRN